MELHSAINLVLALHNHQPVGNLPPVFSRTLEESYRPFLTVLEQHPKIRMVMHYSGVLLEWLTENAPDILDSLRRLIGRGQIEIMGGAYYEPILPIIPDEDKQEQIKLLTTYISTVLGYYPRGAWLAERVWEPHLAESLADSGMDYTVVDDAHFKQVGKNEQDLLGYYLTEGQGRSLAIFPINEKLRYLIPFKEAEETIDYLRSLADSPGCGLLVLADDGEKFGSWPGTSQRVYTEGWLDRFFSRLEKNLDWITLTTFSDYLNSHPPLGRIYLPTASYREMGEWSGGFWRNFLVRYPESNQMHKKMLAARRQVAAMPLGENQQSAWRHIWAAQCNCGYWHGIFGGLYLNFLRSAVYEHLIKAESMSASARHSIPGWAEVLITDQDYDGFNEIRVDTDELTLLCSPRQGGVLQELSYRPSAVNLLDTLTRRFEPYHDDIKKRVAASASNDGSKSIHDLKVVKETGLENYLIYDNYRRAGLIDHFLGGDADFESFRSGNYEEAGDFILGNYMPQILSSNPPVEFILQRNGEVKNQGPVTVVKKITVNSPEAAVSILYTLNNTGRAEGYYRFGSELNLALLAADAFDRYFFIPGQELKYPQPGGTEASADVETIGFCDLWRGFTLTFYLHPAAEVWRFPVETVSQSESGFEKVYQETVMMPLWHIKIPPGGRAEFSVRLEISGRPKEEKYAH